MRCHIQTVERKTMENPVLISPQVDKDYVIHCDASKYSYSGILQQTRPGTEELAPVAYYSGNFDKTQVKWNITEQDSLCYLQICKEVRLLHHWSKNYGL